MQDYNDMSKDDLLEEEKLLKNQYEKFKEQKLKLDMSRGKPSGEQLDLSNGLIDVLSEKDYLTENNTDCRNYGITDGIPEAKHLFAQIFESEDNEVIVGNNSSLNMMYDYISSAMTKGIDGNKPWDKLNEVKFLCPVPGYDRHFTICQFFGIKMINIDMTSDGPDMDMVEKLVKEDESIKGIWCVPKYSNPLGTTFSDETVKRFANLIPKAKDFKIMWDNAYTVHHINTEDKLLNILTECKKTGKEDMPIMFASTSKVTFSGAGISAMAASFKNIEEIKKRMFVQSIGPDKINQLRHVKYFKDINGINNHMKKHAEIIKPKFDMVISKLTDNFSENILAEWENPNGGYFVSVNVMDGCAKRVVELCKQAGVALTPAGATYPYGIDSKDKNIRLAPTFPPVSELQTAMDLFCLCIKLASIEKLKI